MQRSRTTNLAAGREEKLQWGDHVCQFFHTAEDLAEILVPFFKAGLERNESCVWITSNPYGSDRAVSEMRAAVPEFDRQAGAGQIQILRHDEWYLKGGVLDTSEVLQKWLSRKDEAIASGFAGLRVSGNTSFLDKTTWREFLTYEHAVCEALRDQPIVALCSYCVEKCTAAGVLDVMHSHRASLTKRRDGWDLIEIKSHGREASSAEASDHALSQAPYRPASTTRWSTDVRALIEAELAQYIRARPERIALKGDHVGLSSSQAAKLRMLIRELVENAVDDGALCSTRGNLAVQWRAVINGSRHLYITWAESGLSGLSMPDKTGFGTRLRASASEKCVRVSEPTGLMCTFEVDLGAIER